MARLDAPRTSRNSPGSEPGQTDSPHKTQNKGWPFAAGSQNHLDETAARWPRPPSRPDSDGLIRDK